MRDFFGRACYGSIASKCTRKNPLHRYRSIAALRSALKFTQIFPYILISISLFAILIGMLWFQHRTIAALQEEKKQSIEAQAYKDSVLTSLKDEVNLWYEETARPAAEKMSSENDYYKRVKMQTELITSYNSLWNRLVDECPEEYSAEFINWLILKYNKDFPIK